MTFYFGHLARALDKKGKPCRHCGSPAMGNPCWYYTDYPSSGGDPPCEYMPDYEAARARRVSFQRRVHILRLVAISGGVIAIITWLLS
jgi:hypothetical protein